MQSIRPQISVVLVGYADSGKSTLYGHFVEKSGLSSELPKRLKVKPGDAQYYAQLIAKKDEIAAGYTLHVDKWGIFTNNFTVTMIDTPGRALNRFKNTLNGIAQADFGILVVSASFGEFEAALSSGRIREHGVMLQAFGIKHIIVAVNKMDEHDIEEGQSRYKTIMQNTLGELLSVGFKMERIQYIPISALTGDNLVEKSNFEWYTGNTLLQAIDGLDPPIRLDRPFRLSISHTTRGYAQRKYVEGRVAYGTAKPGTVCTIAYPNNDKGEIFVIRMHGQEIHRTSAGEHVEILVRAFRFEDLHSGNVIGDGKEQPLKSAASFIAKIIVLNQSGFHVGITPFVSCNTAHVGCKIQNIISKVHRKTEEEIEKEPKQLKDGDCVLVCFRPTKPMCIEPYDQFPLFGRIVIRDKYQIFGTGTVKSVEYFSGEWKYQHT